MVNIELVKNMLAGSSSLLSVFLDDEHRFVLYYLANKNPRIDEQKIAQATNLSVDRIREILNNLSGEKLVKFEQGHGYTLTEKGLTGLYNFHITVNKK